MPLMHFSLCSKPVHEVGAVVVTALVPQLMGALRYLFFQANAFVYVQRRHVGFLGNFRIHNSVRVLPSQVRARILLGMAKQEGEELAVLEIEAKN